MKFSRMMLGTVQFGLNYGVTNDSGKVTDAMAREIIAFAAAHGVNALDTAANYGDSETVLGGAMKELKLQDKLMVISKIPLLATRDNPREFIKQTVNTSLSRLGIERLAAVLFHNERDYVNIEMLRELEDAGLVGGVGVSLSSGKYCDAVLDAGIKYVQLPYNIFDRRFDSFLECARQRRITVFARSIYLKGLAVMNERSVPDYLRAVLPVRRRVELIAERENMPMTELCLRFVLSEPGITSVLTGVDNMMQLTENLQLFEKGPLDAVLCNEIKAAVGIMSEEIITPLMWGKHAQKK